MKDKVGVITGASLAKTAQSRYHSIHDKVVVITEASSGIGKALAYEFGEKGSKVVVAARNLAKQEEITSDLYKL